MFLTLLVLMWHDNYIGPITINKTVYTANTHLWGNNGSDAILLHFHSVDGVFVGCGKRERAERYPWDLVCFSHPSFSIIRQPLLKRRFIDFLMRGRAMAYQGGFLDLSLSRFLSLFFSACFEVLLYNHNKIEFFSLWLPFFSEKELCLIGAKNKLLDKLFHVCWRGERERARQRKREKEQAARGKGLLQTHRSTRHEDPREKRLTGGKRDGERSRKGRSDWGDWCCICCLLVCRYLCFSGPEFMGVPMLCSSLSRLFWKEILSLSQFSFKVLYILYCQSSNMKKGEKILNKKLNIRKNKILKYNIRQIRQNKIR